MIKRPKGTQDLSGRQLSRIQKVEETIRIIMNDYRFNEVRTPVFESYDLFSRGVGNGTDVVSKEMYDFNDKGDRHLALRPEGTASVVRAYIENKWFGPEFPNPFKAYYIGPMFRYERPQAGRMRQFHQLGCEVFGAVDPSVDVEVISLAMDLFSELGLKQLKLLINSLGQPADRQAYREALINYLKPFEAELSSDSQRRYLENPLRVLDSKDTKDQEIVKNAPKMIDFLSEGSRKHFDRVIELLELFEVPFEIDHQLVRGLDYYQDTVFEIVTNSKEFGANTTICGGGRYDGLVESLGGPSTPGIGFAAGMERLMMLLDIEAVDLNEVEPLDVYIASLGEEAEETVLKLMNQLRHLGYSVDRDYLGRKLRTQFKQAERQQAQVVVTIGSEEVEKQEAVFKGQKTKKELSIHLDDLDESFDALFNQLTLDSSVIDEYFKA